MLGEPPADRPEQGRTDGEVEDADPVDVGQLRDQLGPARLVLDVDGDVGEAGHEALDDGLVELAGADEAGELAADLVAVAGVVETGAGQRDDPRLGGQLTVPVAQVEGGQELAGREVAGATEDDEVGGGDGRRNGVLDRGREGETWCSHPWGVEGELSP